MPTQRSLGYYTTDKPYGDKATDAGVRTLISGDVLATAD